MMDLWDRAHDLFDTDDGSLPEVMLVGLSHEEVAAVYGKIRSFAGAARQRDQPAVFWNERLEREFEVDACPDVVGAVVRGDSLPVHFVLLDVSVAGVPLPELGIRVEPDGIGIDWRMGSEWERRQLVAFFEFIYELASLAPQSRFEFRAIGGEMFLSAWKYFLESHKLRRIPQLGGQTE